MPGKGGHKKKMLCGQEPRKDRGVDSKRGVIGERGALRELTVTDRWHSPQKEMSSRGGGKVPGNG